VLGAGSGGGVGRSAPAGGGRDFSALGFPHIASDAVMHTQSGRASAPNPVSVFIIRLRKQDPPFSDAPPGRRRALP
jgi:hypothetical protein